MVIIGLTTIIMQNSIAKDVFLLDKLTDFVVSFTKKLSLEPDCFYGVPEGATKLGILTQYIPRHSIFTGSRM